MKRWPSPSAAARTASSPCRWAARSPPDDTGIPTAKGRLIRLFAVLFAAVGFAAAGSAYAGPREQGADFDALWSAIDTGYAYFEGAHGAWRRARERWRPAAVAARSREEWLAALEGLIAELRDDHVTLSETTPASPRRVPSEIDVWAQWRQGLAVITAVRTFSDADVANVHPGQVVTQVKGIPIERAVRERLGHGAPHCAIKALSPRDQAACDWALRQVLAGPRSGAFSLTVRGTRGEERLAIERGAKSAANGPLLVARRMGEERDLGYVRLKNDLGDARLAVQFDAAMHNLQDTRGLILDLRETPDGGTREIVEAILGWFVDKEIPWQVREAPGRNRVSDFARPRGNTPYRASVVVLIDRWTAAEGEGLAAGLEAAANATLIGTPTAGLRGELREVKLPNSAISVRFPAERTLRVNGKPRDAAEPALEVDLAAPQGGPGDPILYQGLKRLESRRTK